MGKILVDEEVIQSMITLIDELMVLERLEYRLLSELEEMRSEELSGESWKSGELESWQIGE